MENFIIKSVRAQTNLPSEDAPVIQRTIEEENSDGLLQSQVTTQSEAQAQSQKTVVMGLAAILLLVIAIVGIALLWRGSSKPSAPLPPVPPTPPKPPA